MVPLTLKLSPLRWAVTWTVTGLVVRGRVGQSHPRVSLRRADSPSALTVKSVFPTFGRFLLLA
jgi:hypothetical protein